MNLSILRLRATRLIADIIAYFDGGIEGAIEAFVKVDRKLDALHTKLVAQFEREVDAVQESYYRQQQAIDAETTVRAATYQRMDTLTDQVIRASSIRARISKLLD